MKRALRQLARDGSFGLFVLGLVALALVIVGCSSPHPISTPPPKPTPSVSSPAPTPSPVPSVPIQTAKLLWSMKGTGPMVLTPATDKAKVLTVRFTCAGSGRTSIRSAGGGLIVGTSGCNPTEVAGATFTRTKRLDPNKLVLTVDPNVTWAIEVWAGTYVVQQPTGINA